MRDSPREIDSVPQDDGGRDQVETGCAVLLVLEGAVPDLAEVVEGRELALPFLYMIISFIRYRR